MPRQARRLHFVGIGGISMSSLAAIAFSRGYLVSGSDRAPSALTARLENMGITVYYGHRAEQADSADIIVYTAAVASDNPELVRAAERNIPCVTRAAFLGWMMKDYRVRIGVAGTHGKSTTTSMLAEIYLAGELDPTVVSGAVLPSLDGAYRIGGDSMIFEACEYTDSFLSFFPSTAVITNVDWDHLDYFPTVEQYIDSFARYIALADLAVVNLDSPNAPAAIQHYTGKLITCSLTNPDALYRAQNIVYERGCASFTLHRANENLGKITLSVPGEHNVGDALCAAAAALENDVPFDAVVLGLRNFHGAQRRFEYKGEINGARIYDDYAHHPVEIKATLAAAKKIGGRIICLFQPHTRSRLTELFDDFATAFSDADLTAFVDVYENLEHEMLENEHDSRELSARVNGSVYLPDLDALTDFAAQNARPGDTILVMGAGSITRVAATLAKKGQ